MAYGKATVVDSGNSSGSLTNTVREAAGNAVRNAQNSGASKADVIKARDAAKESVYAGAVQAINTGGSYKGMSAQQLHNELYGGLEQTATQHGTPIALVQSRNHLQNMQNAGFYDAEWNPTNKALQGQIQKNQSQPPITVIDFKPAAVQPKELSIRERINYESMRLKESKIPIIRGAAAYLPNYYDPEVMEKAKENNIDFNEVASSVSSLMGPIGILNISESDKNPFRTDKNKLVDATLEGLFYGFTGEDVSGKSEIVQAAGNRGTNWIDAKTGALHEWSMRNLDGRFYEIGSFVRGMVPDSIVGVGTLISEGTKTITAGFREAKKSGANLTGITRGQAMSTSFAGMLGFGIGTIAGGTVRGAIDDPIAFAGGLIGTGGAGGIGKLGMGVGKFRLKAFKQAAGKIDVSLKDLGVDPKVIKMGGDVYRLEGKAAFPDAYPVKTGIKMHEGVSMLENAKNLYPGEKSGSTAIIHSSPKNRGDIYSPHVGKSSEPGMFGAESPSIRFMKIPYFKNAKLVGFSNPFSPSKLNELSPRIMFIEGKGIRSPEVTSGVKTNKFLLNDADAGYFWTTHKMRQRIESGKLVEVEAVVSPKTTISTYDNKPYSDATLYRIESKYRTTVKQPIDFPGIKMDVDLKVPVEKYIMVTADDMALVPVSAPAKKSKFFSPDSHGKDGSLTYPVGTNMNLHTGPKPIRTVTEISKKNGSIKEMFTARRTASADVVNRHKAGMASKNYDAKKLFESAKSKKTASAESKPITSAASPTAARISELTDGKNAGDLIKKTSNTQSIEDLIRKKAPPKTKKSDSGSSRKSPKQPAYPLVDLTYSPLGVSRGAKSKSKPSNSRGGYYSPTSGYGYGSSKSSSPGYSGYGGGKSSSSKTAPSKATTRPIVHKQTSKKLKKEEPISPAKRTKKTTKKSTKKEFRVNPLRGLKI
ncbi:MAG: hypothetical protein LBU81_01920 [Methanosarcinales archaeon]|jgi:hypothetical protein|nr:hypothetical protein [Methanosarcinales archaeon]